MATFPNPRMPSPMKHAFSRVPVLDIPRSVFDRSRSYKTVFDSGYLVPVFFDEVLPGDTMELSTSALIRMTTLAVPFMDNIRCSLHFFAVPNRILWSHWVNFMGEKDSPDDSTEYVTPKIVMTSGSSAGNPLRSIYDYMGVAIGAEGNTINNFLGRSYNQIWNRFYRDQNQQDPVTVDLGDGPDDLVNYNLLKRGKPYDYFTSCLPWPQKGPAVDIPLVGNAPVRWSTFSGSMTADDQFAVWNTSGTPAYTTGYGSTEGVITGNTPPNSSQNAYADLSQAASATINQLRQSFQVQAIYEIDARGGTRYPEMILSHFGVHNPDSRMQYPEYIGGGHFPIDVSALAQTSATGVDGTPLGELAGVGVGNVHGIGFRHSFTEHCVVIGLVCAAADLTYQQGTHRMWYRSTRFDYYFPAFAHLGEQAVLNREIWTQGTAGDSNPDGSDTDVFGYNEYASEYRYGQSFITADMRSDAPNSLDYWHLSQDFADLPKLSSAFIEENPPIDRVVAVTSEPQFRGDFFFKVRHVRPLPVYSVPGTIMGGHVL